MYNYGIFILIADAALLGGSAIRLVLVSPNTAAERIPFQPTPTVKYNDLRNAIAGSLQVTESTKKSKFTKVRATDAVHICLIAVGAGAIGEFRMFLSSLKRHASAKKHVFHVVTDLDSKVLLKDAVQDNGFQDYDAVILNATNVSNTLKELKIKYSHHSAIAGVTKSFMLELFPAVDRCIVVDTDIFAAKPLNELYMQMNLFNAKEILGATWRPRYEWGDKINTGIMLQDFQKMRSRGWSDAMKNSFDSLKIGGSKFKDGFLLLHWPDQEIMHATLMSLDNERNSEHKPESLHVMDHGWNMEMCRNFFGGCAHHNMGLLHFNCGGDNWWSTVAYREKKHLLKNCVQNLP